MSHNYKSNNQDSEPLIDSSLSLNSPPIAKTNRFRNNRKLKLPALNFRRRDQERCGRVRLLAILSCFVCFLIYVTNLKPYQNLMIVKIPEDDINLPGPKGKLSLNCVLNYLLVHYCLNLNQKNLGCEKLILKTI
jgi:hypothetical protein